MSHQWRKNRVPCAKTFPPRLQKCKVQYAKDAPRSGESCFLSDSPLHLPDHGTNRKYPPRCSSCFPCSPCRGRISTRRPDGEMETECPIPSFRYLAGHVITVITIYRPLTCRLWFRMLTACSYNRGSASLVYVSQIVYKGLS
jgi:hypothetical protein